MNRLGSRLKLYETALRNNDDTVALPCKTCRNHNPLLSEECRHCGDKDPFYFRSLPCRTRRLKILAGLFAFVFLFLSYFIFQALSVWAGIACFLIFMSIVVVRYRIVARASRQFIDPKQAYQTMEKLSNEQELEKWKYYASAIQEDELAF